MTVVPCAAARTARSATRAVFVVRGLDQVVDDPDHLLVFSGDRRVMPALRPRCLRAAGSFPPRVAHVGYLVGRR